MRQFTFIVFFISQFGFSQSINFGDQTSLYLSDGTSFFFGGNTTLNGNFTNNGTVISYSDMDFVENRDVGNLKFTGADDQILFGDTLAVGDFIIDKQGKLTLQTSHVDISGELRTDNGVLEADDEDIIVSGNVGGSGSGFIEGKLLGKSNGNPITFPMGVNGAPNYVTLSNLPVGAIVSVECRMPDATTLLPDEDLLGIGDEVEWVIKVEDRDSLNAQLVFNYSGVDLNSVQRNFRSNEEAPGLVIYSKSDSLFHEVNGTLSSTSDLTQGTITVNDNLLISSEGSRLAIALIPSIGQPDLFVPNAFSPTSAIEENRVFRAYYAGAIVKELSIAVYDSFNKQVYSATDSGEDLDVAQYAWDGILDSGLEAPEGVYYFKVRVVSGDGVEFSETGSVLLVK